MSVHPWENPYHSRREVHTRPASDIDCSCPIKRVSVVIQYNFGAFGTVVAKFYISA